MTTTTQSLERIARESQRLTDAKVALLRRVVERRVQVARNELDRAIKEFVEVEIALRASEEGNSNGN